MMASISLFQPYTLKFLVIDVVETLYEMLSQDRPLIDGELERQLFTLREIAFHVGVPLHSTKGSRP
jgi:hypothetical protein